MIIGRNILATLTLAAALAVGWVPGASAQIGRNSQLAEDHVEKAESAVKKGEFNAAAQHFSRALRAEDTDDKSVARILYRRGSAFERAGKPAQAIADLTKALYLPSLSSADRAKAYLSRGRAYEAVGLGDRARSDIANARSGGVDEREIARSGQPAQPSASTGGGPSFETVSEGTSRRAGTTPAFATRSSAASGSTPSFRTSSAGAPAPRPSFRTSTSGAPAAQPKRQQVAAFDTRTRAARSGEEQIPRFRTTILPGGAGSQAASSSTQDSSSEESSGTVKRIFGNLWSNATGGEKKEPEAATPAAPQWSQRTQTARAPAPSWTSQSSASSAPSPASAPAPTGPTARPAPSAGGSGYRIQLAALKTDAEAQAAWKRLRSRHAGLLGQHQPNIVKTELGGLGTFYRLQLGPFADKDQSKQLCQQFKAGGLDCFLLAP